MIKVIRTDDNAFQINLDARGCKKDWEQWVLFRSDGHHDNAHCRDGLEREHLEEAKHRNAIVLDGGDLFCAMQGRHDKRRSPEALKNKFQGKSNFFDLIVDDAAEFYGPYADRMLIFAHGNHETSVLKNIGINLTENLCRRLNMEHGGNCLAGLFSNYIRFNVRMTKTSTQDVTLYHHHGYGGGGHRTDGVMQFKDKSVHHRADILWMGHIHKLNSSHHVFDYLNGSGKIVKKRMTFLRTSTYKDEHGKGVGGWSVERGYDPVPMGATWVRFFIKNRNVTWETYETADI
jgi:hypothetical protein